MTLPARIDTDCYGELTRLRERVAILEREIVAVRPQPLLESLDESPIPVWTTLNERVVFANAAALEIVGAAAPREVIGRSVFDFVAPEYHDLVRSRSREEVELGRETPVVEQQIVDLSGKRIDVQVSSFAFPYEGLRARHISFIDITQRKAAERVLLETNERFHELAENVREVFTIVDPNQRKMLYVSPGYEQLWHRSRESLYQNPNEWMEAVHPDDLSRIRSAAESPAPFGGEYRILRPTGEMRWIRSRTYPIRASDGSLLRVVGFSEDITEWKRLEQQLVQSQKMDAVGRLAGGIAHDFNNLLTVINGYSALLADRLDLPVDMVADLHSIRRAGERAASLTAQLLAFSRKQVLQPKTLDLNAAVAGVEPILRRLIREDVELKIALASSQAFVKADPSQLEQVLLNLVINARDAIDQTGTITVETGMVEFDAQEALLHSGCAAGHYAMLAVSDTGRGMSAQTQERIFEPFFTTKGPGHGTGLGLATVYGIVKQSSGTIWVYSEEGVGTTFKVYLPLVVAAAAVPAEPEKTRAANGTGTVLIVEDDEQVRSIASAVLTARGYQVMQATNGEDALQKASGQTGGIDLLVTDVIMPKMGGRELAERLAVGNPDMRVLFISGYTENAAIHKGVMAAGLHHLAKPFTPDALARKVSEVLAPQTMKA